MPERIYPPELTDPLRLVLGIPNFRCHPYATVMRAAGWKIPFKTEEEQAVVLDWLVRIVLKHGAQWEEAAHAELNAMCVEAKRRIEPAVAEATGPMLDIMETPGTPSPELKNDEPA